MVIDTVNMRISLGINIVLLILLILLILSLVVRNKTSEPSIFDILHYDSNIKQSD
jgi:hypothetical protein